MNAIDEHFNRRRHEHFNRRRRQRRTRIILVVLLVLLGVALTLLFASRADAAVRKPGPYRVLLIGDSITYQYQDEAASLLAAKGYQVTKFGLPTTGLLDAALCRGQVAKTLLDAVQPDIVVYEQVGNYWALNGWGGRNARCSEKVLPQTPGFYKQWTRSAKLTQKILTRKGARFYWVAMPPVTHPGYTAVTPRVTAIHRTLGPMVETWPSYNAAFHYDGLHLTQAGQDRLAQVVAKVVTG